MSYDVAVIGAGPGGYVAAIRAAQLGLKVAVIERDEIGGICLNWGCIPSKALLKSAEVAELIAHAGDYGIHVDGARIDLERMVARSRGVVDRLVKGIGVLFKKHGIVLVKGTGVLKSKGVVEVSDGTRVEARHVILATGARAKSLPGVEIDRVRIVTSKEAMLQKQVPKRLLVIGAGAVGLEFAYFYAALGSKVTVLEYLDRALPNEDEEISRLLQRALAKKGIDIRTGVRVESVVRKGDIVRAAATAGTDKLELEADLALMAVGVAANVEGLGLEQAGVTLSKRGFVEIDERGETKAKGVWAIGDMTGRILLAHVAMQEGVRVAERIAGKSPQPIAYDNVPSCTYCQPQVASVGLTEAAAKARGLTYKVGKFPFAALGRALAAGDEQGMVKVLIGNYGELLGAHVIGAGATDIIAELALARGAEATDAEIMNTIHAHPTLPEAIQEAVAAAHGEAIHI